MHAAVLGNSVAAMSALRGNSVTPMSALPGNSVTPMSALPGNSVTPMAALLVERMAALRMQGPAGRGWPVRLMVAAGMAAGPALHCRARGMAAAGTAAGSTLVHMTAVAPVAASRTAGTLCGCERHPHDERCRRGCRQQGIHPRAPHANLPLPSVVIVTP